MSLKHFQISDPLVHKQWSDQLTAVMPLLPIGGKNTVPKEIMKLPIKSFPFAEVIELGGKHSFYDFMVGCKDISSKAKLSLNSVG